MEQERQKLKSSDPNTIINKAYIESNEYRRKFDKISDDTKFNRIVYSIAKKMLYHRNGTNNEDMYWLDPISYKEVAQELNSPNEKEIKYSRKTKKIIKRNKNLITIHSHPDGFPPSVADFNANYRYKYSLGIVCGHNGSLFLYKSNGKINDLIFSLKVNELKKMRHNEYEAQLLALQKMSESYKIEVKEVL